MECLAHLKSAVQDEDYVEMRRKIAAFTTVTEVSVERWFGEAHEPSGESLLRLRFYLDLHGYNVTELHEIQGAVLDAGRIFAFGIVPLSEIAQMVGYPDGRSGIDTLLRLFRGVSKAPQARLQQFATLVELYRGSLSEKQQSISKIDAVHRKYANLNNSVHKFPALAPKPAPDMHTSILETLSGMVKGMIPLAKLVASDEFSEEERKLLREMAGETGVFTLANELYRMCGARSRDMHS